MACQTWDPPFERCEMSICGDYVYSVSVLRPRGLGDLGEGRSILTDLRFD